MSTKLTPEPFSEVEFSSGHMCLFPETSAAVVDNYQYSHTSSEFEEKKLVSVAQGGTRSVSLSP